VTIVNSSQSLKDVISLIEQTQKEFGYIEVEITVKGKARTGQQNRALHKYCDQMANKLNEGGVSYIKWLEHKKYHGIETSWSMPKFKEVFKDYAGAKYPECIDKKGEPKTSKLTREQITKVYDLVNERMSVIFGQGLDWPSLDKEAWSSAKKTN